MKNFRNAIAAIMIAVSLGVAMPAMPAQAGAKDPLFVNLTSDDGHRINMARTFGGKQMERGHPLTVFLNDRAVFAASTAYGERFAGQQKTIADLLAAGATISVCPLCMKHYRVKQEDLLRGLKVGNPELTCDTLFADNAKTLTW